MEINQDSGSYVLLKFFGEKRYAEEFLNGSLYMNTLNFFQEQNVYKRIEELGKAHIPSYPETFPESGDLNNVLVVNKRVRKFGYLMPMLLRKEEEEECGGNGH